MQLIATAGIVDIGQVFSSTIQPYVNAAVEAIISGLVAWVLLKVKDKFHVDIEAKHREALTNFLTQKASALLADGAVKLQGVKVEVKSDALAAAANEALKRIPDALTYFGLTPETLRNRIVDLLPKEPAVAAAQAVALDVKNPETPTVTPVLKA